MAKEKLPELPRWNGPLSHPFYSKVVKRILDFVLAVILFDSRLCDHAAAGDLGEAGFSRPGDL